MRYSYVVLELCTLFLWKQVFPRISVLDEGLEAEEKRKARLLSENCHCHLNGE
jgi:hypothetical protein